MGDVDDLLTWLRAQIDADEARTRALLYWAQQTILTLQDPKLLGKHIPGWHDWPDVERMCQQRLAELDAKRRILDRCEQAYREQGIYGEDGQEQVAEDLLLLLALPYADRPGYREEWKP